MEVPVDFDNDLSVVYTYSVTFEVRLQTTILYDKLYVNNMLSFLSTVPFIATKIHFLCDAFHVTFTSFTGKQFHQVGI